MHKILIVDDEEATLTVMKIHLSNAYKLICTHDAEQALMLALEHKPDAIFLDLMMPKLSGFELCQSFRSLRYTSMIPLIVITAEQNGKYKEHCANLGAVGYFEKPLDFDEIKRTLTAKIGAKRSEHRAYVRVRMRLAIKLAGTDTSGREFEERTITENVSASGFLCNCMSALAKGMIVEVTLSGGSERYAGQAQVVREESSSGTPWYRYGFNLVEKTQNWPFQGSAHLSDIAPPRC
jgi:DNA-binding response OmpR family regulator